MNKTNETKAVTLSLTLEEAILTRDAMINEKHNLKGAPSERGQRLSQLAGAIGKQLDDKINNRRF